jgi:glycosyltransferase involved in cell wall biosynthesis
MSDKSMAREACGPTILLVANYEPQVGYAWNFIAKFWTRLTRRGQCHLAYPTSGPVPNEITQAGIATHTQPMRGWQSVAFIRRQEIHTIYLTDWPPLSPLYALWRLAGVRQIIVHDHVPGDVSPARGLRRLLKRALHGLRIFSADQYIGVAEHVRQRHIHTWCAPADRCVTVTNGIEPFEVDATEGNAVRAELGIPDDAVVFLMVGRASAYKNFRFAIECLPYLPDHAHMIHCGDGPELESLRDHARRYGLESRMHFLGKRSDVRRIMSACNAAFHPSRGEAMSLAILEFACAGLPVVVPDTPSVSFTVEHMADGLRYKAGDISSAVLQLQYLLDAKRRQRLGAMARQRIFERYTIDRTLAEFDARVRVT